MRKSDVFGGREGKRSRVYGELAAYIQSTDRKPGQPLASVRRLAELFGTSVHTIHMALKDLERDGYVRTRQGLGTFLVSRHRPLTMADAVAVSVGVGHVWSDLLAILMEKLAARERVATVMNLEDKGLDEGMARRLAHSEARTFIVVGGRHFPFRLFEQPAFREKTVISLTEWVSDLRWPGLFRVLSDVESAGREVARRLWGGGHRKVLIAGTPTQVPHLVIPYPNEPMHGHGFWAEWSRLGGQYSVIASRTRDDGLVEVDEDAIERLFTSSEAPSAVFGLRDCEAWLVQDALLRRLPARTPETEIVGFGDTPWSAAGHPAFSTLSYDLPALCDEAMRILDALQAGEAPGPEPVMVPMKLVVREHAGRQDREAEGHPAGDGGHDL